MTPATFRRGQLLIAVVCMALGLLCLSGIAWAQTPAKPAPWWATSLAVAGPLADGLSTHYALGHPSVREGNPFFAHLFGSNVTRNEILAFKAGQAALYGWVTRSDWNRNRERAIGLLAVNVVVHAVVSGFNIQAARQARRLHHGTHGGK